MRKLALTLLFSVLVLAPVLAQQAGPGSPSVPGGMMVGGVQVNLSTERGRELQQIRERVQARVNQSLNGTGARTRAEQRVMNTHGYRVQSYVHGLLETADMINGSIGPQVRTVAQSMNQSTQRMAQAEAQANGRGPLARLLIGPDRAALNEAEQQLNQTRQRIRDLEQHLTGLEDEAVQAMIQEQIQNMEQQLTQASEQVEEQKQKRGLFGFLFGRRQVE